MMLDVVVNNVMNSHHIAVIQIPLLISRRRFQTVEMVENIPRSYLAHVKVAYLLRVRNVDQPYENL